jgi:prepilin-type N-terminal cleavage/methylation domain-containing protein
MRRQHGFTMIELLVAIMLIAVGILATFGVLFSSQHLTLAAEHQTSLAHRAQRELERLQSLPYDQLAMASSLPAHSTDTANPDYYVTTDTPAKFQYDRSNPSSTEAFVTGGAISATPTSTTDGGQTYNVYDFVTWTTDPNCGPNCPASQNYKRVTVMVTLTGAAHPRRPALVSTIVVKPDAAPAGATKDSQASPLQDSNTTCQVGTDASGNPIYGSCTNGIDGTPLDYYLYDTSSQNTTRQAITGDHATHNTIAPVTGVTCSPTFVSGCQEPNLMGTDPPPAPTPLPACYKYSTNVTGHTYQCGQVLKQDVSCSTAPSWTAGYDENKGDFWVTNPLSSNTVLNGSGGATLFMQSATGVAVTATICMGIFVAPQTNPGLAGNPPVEAGAVSLTNVSIPTALTPIAFNFSGAFGTTGGLNNTYTFAAGKRIGVRVWIGASTGDVALAYDHPQYASVVQVNAQ